MRKATRRKHWPLVDCVQHGIAGARKTPQDALDKLRLTELLAIDSFARGKASLEDFRTLCDCLNLCETLVAHGVGGDEAANAVIDAQAALLDAKERFERTGKLGLTGPGLTALQELHAWHDAQREAISRGLYERAIQATRDRIRSSHPSLKVLA